MTSHRTTGLVATFAIGLVFTACSSGTRDEQGMQTHGVVKYEARGAGEPVLLIHRAYLEDAMLPLAGEPALSSHRVVRYHRRGYGSSVAHDRPFDVRREAEDGLALLKHLDIESAHVVGYSSGGIIALELALS